MTRVAVVADDWALVRAGVEAVPAPHRSPACRRRDDGHQAISTARDGRSPVSLAVVGTTLDMASRTPSLVGPRSTECG